jgi:hypothetical protein
LLINNLRTLGLPLLLIEELAGKIKLLLDSTVDGGVVNHDLRVVDGGEDRVPRDGLAEGIVDPEFEAGVCHFEVALRCVSESMDDLICEREERNLRFHR